MREWEAVAVENGITLKAFRERVNKLQWTLEEAATTPVGKRIKSRIDKHDKWLKIAK